MWVDKGGQQPRNIFYDNRLFDEQFDLAKSGSKALSNRVLVRKRAFTGTRTCCFIYIYERL